VDLCRVDEGEPDRNRNELPTRQAAWFGGGDAPRLNLTYIKEVVVYNDEVDDCTLESVHSNLMSRWIAPAPPILSPPPPGAPATCPRVDSNHHECCSDGCAHASDGMCDDGGPGAEYSLCALGSDCLDCSSRCYLSDVPEQPYIHSAWPNVSMNTGGFYKGVEFNRERAALYRGSWTISFVFAGSYEQVSQLSAEQLIYDGEDWDTRTDRYGHGTIQRIFDRSILSSIGVGAQIYCGRTTPWRNIQQSPALWHSTAAPGAGSSVDRQYEGDFCIGTYSKCNYIVFEGSGPENNDMWCRTARIETDAAHHCREDPNLLCHVITLRVGPKFGVMLNVDEELAPIGNAQPIRSRQLAWFGGGYVPRLKTQWMREIVIYNRELSDACVQSVHESLMTRHIDRRAAIRSNLPPPPRTVPPAPPRMTRSPEEVARSSTDRCAAHVPWVSTSRGTDGSHLNVGGRWRGSEVGLDGKGGPFWHGEWTILMVVEMDGDNWATRRIFGDGNGSWTSRVGSLVGVGAQEWCGKWTSGDYCAQSPTESACTWESHCGLSSYAIDEWVRVSNYNSQGQPNCGTVYSCGSHGRNSYINELDRGRCTSEELFGSAYSTACKTAGGNCPFFTVEAHGYGDKRVWCRTVRAEQREPISQVRAEWLWVDSRNAGAIPQ
jgi:hypothetical protein